LKSQFRTQWSLFPSGLTCSRFDNPIDKKTRDLIKRKNTLSKKVASSSDHPIRQEYNRVRNKVKGAVNKMKKKFEKYLYENGICVYAIPRYVCIFLNMFVFF
jgi:uncharacterized protein with LGFP repeats